MFLIHMNLDRVVDVNWSSFAIIPFVMNKLFPARIN